MAQLQYIPFISSIEPTFWTLLNTKKLDELKLDERGLAVTGFYTNDAPQGIPSQLRLSYSSFDSSAPPDGGVQYQGELLNTNTIEDFKAKDYNALLNSAGEKVWEVITSGAALSSPALLNQFFVLTFADLKKFNYHYWFCYPVVTCPAVITGCSQKLGAVLSEAEETKVSDMWAASSKGIVLTSAEFDPLPFEQVKDSFKDRWIVLSDPSTDPDYPGWPLRNILALLSYNCSEVSEAKIICLRESKVSGAYSIKHSLVLNVKLTPLTEKSEMPKVVGWERNLKKKLAPKFVDLSSSMDPAKISESSVNLNLKLMRWRLLPELDLEKLYKLKVLVLGSGTLGCNVGRCLMGWGVKNITMVDNGTVSYSNPVRQSLFNFTDCHKPKAETAAQRMRDINPGANVTGVHLSIAMPGHTVTDGEKDKVEADVAALEALIGNHDVVFLLTDTRESRWLPTVIASAKRKIVINSALGFDTYLVMRHGVKDEAMTAAAPEIGKTRAAPEIGAKRVSGTQLGCYFCNDVVAPGDSTRDRTLDQMCTVTRPGNAYIASALAVEMMVSVIQHPLQGAAPATMDLNDESEDSCLGRVPHQIRGFLAHFYSVQPTSHSFDKCTACCSEVIDRYTKDGFTFLLEAFNTPNYLEKISGLAQMIEDTDFDNIWEFDSGDSDGEMK